MKKTKFLSFILIISIMAMGAGYAYWSQDLSITNTVSTGDLDVQFLPVNILESGDYSGTIQLPDDILALLSSPRHFDGSDYMDVNLGYTGKDTINVTFDKIYPGAGGFVSFIIVNQGTVPAKLKDVRTEGVDETYAGLKDYLDYSVRSVIKFQNNGGIYTNYEVIETPIQADTLDEFRLALKEQLKDVTLQPSELIIINLPWWLGGGTIEYDETEALRSGYSISMPTNIDGIDDNDLEGQTLEFDLKLEYEQQTQ
ncbi:hypothetical protein Amet_0494 [Alkaliphilus metalliredigens QYMF]|uniref:Uncharacterized protein n=1 Tax=Alkaliphilus metalliredigens (strain QYMF) TaxID=293826 RepID=A6TKK3_ALKMQ|nr:hypothetical protein [Alkaliphilus metalliredigens]ABR46721.1 hypothetical protein Amet_0494 [Alkaliphilus metalliredigens QYMF]